MLNVSITCGSFGDKIILCTLASFASGYRDVGRAEGGAAGVKIESCCDVWWVKKLKNDELKSRNHNHMQNGR